MSEPIILNYQDEGVPELGHGLLFLGNKLHTGGSSGKKSAWHAILDLVRHNTWENVYKRMRKCGKRHHGWMGQNIINDKEQIEFKDILNNIDNTCVFAVSFPTKSDAEHAAKECGDIWEKAFPGKPFYAIYTEHQITVKSIVHSSLNVVIDRIKEVHMRHHPFTLHAETNAMEDSLLTFTFAGSSQEARQRSTQLEGFLTFWLGGSGVSTTLERVGSSQMLACSNMATEVRLREISKPSAPSKRLKI